MADMWGTELVELCEQVRAHLIRKAYQECVEDICHAMYLHPDSPEPHNLMGILLEKQKNHTGAMKHFRAALDLDPTYRPAQENLIGCSSFERPISCYRFCYGDCSGEQK